MAFGVNTLVTAVGKGIAAKRHLGATPAQLEPKWVSMGVGATGAARTAALADTALSTEVESRIAGTTTTVTTTNTNDTYQSVATITASASRACDEGALFDQVATTANGAVTAASATVTVLSTTGFAASGNFFLGANIVAYTGVTATTFTGCSNVPAASTGALCTQGSAISNMFTSATYNVVNLNSGDSVAFTWKVQFS